MKAPQNIGNTDGASYEDSGRLFLVTRRDVAGMVTEFSKVGAAGALAAVQSTLAGERLWITEISGDGVCGWMPEEAAAR